MSAEIIEGYKLLNEDRWNDFSLDHQDLIKEATAEAWYVYGNLQITDKNHYGQITYPEFGAEIIGILKCTHRLISLFLSDEANVEEYKTDSKLYKYILAFDALKISWVLLSQNTRENFISIEEYYDTFSFDRGEIYEEKNKLKFLEYEFKLLKYPINKCLTYIDKESLTPSEFQEALKELYDVQLNDYQDVNVKYAIDNVIDKYKQEFAKYMRSYGDAIEAGLYVSEYR